MLRGFTTIKITVFLVVLIGMSSCASGKGATVTAVKPRTHNTWYYKHTYKRKWHIGRLRIFPEKQDVKKVKMKG